MFYNHRARQRTTRGDAGMKNIKPNSVYSVNSVVKCSEPRDGCKPIRASARGRVE